MHLIGFLQSTCASPAEGPPPHSESLCCPQTINYKDALATMVVVLCCMHCTSTRPEQVLWTSLVAAVRHLTDLQTANLMQRLTNGFCHRSAA